MEKKIGQLVVIGFDGTETTPELRSLVREEGIGGVILFRRNIVSRTQVMRLIGRLQEEAVAPLIVAIDQEGGRVQRLPASFGTFPSMAEVAREAREKDDPSVAYTAAERIAGTLKPLGFNLDFAPVLDVATNIFNPIIGDRAFGADPAFVAELGVQFIRGLMDGVVGACGKHFPGHGDTDADSHLELPLLPHTRKRLEACEWVPFRAAIEAGLPSIMTTHLMVPNLDRDNMVTVSREVTHNVLRNDLGFEGVIFSDDLTMDGIARHMSMSDAAVRSIAAGADMILICEGMEAQREAINALKQAVDAGMISEHHITQSLARLNELKSLINR